MTDMYYHLKEVLKCQDCEWPLSYSYDVGYMCYMAKCPVCKMEYQVNDEKILKGKKK